MEAKRKLTNHQFSCYHQYAEGADEANKGELLNALIPHVPEHLPALRDKTYIEILIILMLNVEFEAYPT